MKSVLKNYKTLPYLALLSGVCGLGYEILYARVLTFYFGDTFTVTMAVLVSVFLGLSIGAWWSRFLTRLLPGIEFLLGLYALLLGFIFKYWGFEFVLLWSDFQHINLFKVIVLMVIPSVLIGTAMPIFAHYLELVRQQMLISNFTKIYKFYNLGAVLGVIGLEFFVIRTFGVTAALWSMALVNFIITGFLLIQQPYNLKVRLSSTKKTAFWRTSWVWILAFGSLISGVFQVFYLRLSYHIWGPLHENFSVILVASLLGLVIGTTLVDRFKLRVKTLFLGAFVSLLLLLISLKALIYLWSGFNTLGSTSDFYLLIKSAHMIGGAGLFFIFIGGLIPAIARESKLLGIESQGRLLAVSSFSNGLGMLLFALFLYQTFTLLLVAQLMILGVLILFLLQNKWFWTYKVLFVFTAALAVFVSGFNWPANELQLGYKTIYNKEWLKSQVKNIDNIEYFKWKNQDTTIINLFNGDRLLVLNGYLSLVFGDKEKATVHETIVGAR